MSSNAAKLPKRSYGTTGIQLSIIGFGGILVMNAEQDHANRLVAEAVERGINYFDVAPSYGDAEIHLGPALEPFRKDVFLACKTGERTAEKAEFELNRSLERLRTDHFDLYQLHGIMEVEKDVDVAFGKGGVMELLIQAKKDGRITHIGFSTHNYEAAGAALDRYDFDSVLYPVNFSCWLEGGFGPGIMKKAQEKGAARLAIKGMAKSKWPEDDPQRENFKKCWYKPITDREEAELALRFTLNQPITAALPPGEEKCFRMALDIVPDLRPLDDSELEQLRKIAEDTEPIFEASKP